MYKSTAWARSTAPTTDWSAHASASTSSAWSCSDGRADRSRLDFVSCASCRAVYFDPLPPIVVTPREGSTGGGAIGGPDGGRSCNTPPKRHDALMRDVREAAKDYVKPGRKTPSRR